MPASLPTGNEGGLTLRIGLMQEAQHDGCAWLADH
jgi:hypothetical protein